jgi:hypothetical protein
MATYLATESVRHVAVWITAPNNAPHAVTWDGDWRAICRSPKTFHLVCEGNDAGTVHLLFTRGRRVFGDPDRWELPVCARCRRAASQIAQAAS